MPQDIALNFPSMLVRFALLNPGKTQIRAVAALRLARPQRRREFQLAAQSGATGCAKCADLRTEFYRMSGILGVLANIVYRQATALLGARAFPPFSFAVGPGITRRHEHVPVIHPHPDVPEPVAVPRPADVCRDHGCHCVGGVSPLADVSSIGIALGAGFRGRLFLLPEREMRILD